MKYVFKKCLIEWITERIKPKPKFIWQKLICHLQTLAWRQMSV